MFTSTVVNGRHYTLEDLIAIILRQLRNAVINQFGVSANSSIHLEDTLERWRFESWIQPDIQNIASCVTSLLDQHNVSRSDIGSVFLTGGSSFVPYVRRYFSKTFGAEKLRGSEELTTVAKGLALRALET